MDEDVNDLSPIKVCWSIQVKVLNKWRERSDRGSRSVCMVLADERDHRIEANIKHKDIFRFDSKIKDGDWIAIHHFRLKTVTEDRRTTKHDYRIIFLESTIVNPIPPKDALEHTLSDVSFPEIMNDIIDKTYLISLIGFVVDPGELHYFDPSRKIYDFAVLVFKIQDTDNNVIECIAIGSFAEQFNDEWIRARGDEFRLDINPDIPEVEEFLEILAAEDANETGSAAYED
ncbi:Nucleic acid-binding OB-fold [Arabidopsis thaliana x Arabidopsis arenosa]|uniref:Nucleic acid-binding OB-fold n=1 Tax=Arabidopsis thaliana x Arabidopsis arenosa TaxID=1240361 RepID=A0A8T1ZLT6_9BRAS|nr:Nucleic acid-binding OB-fold [Arabidopsis thaliana x Arabidopsis arenosa]